MAKSSTKTPKPRSPKAEAADPATAPERLAELAAQAVELARVVAKNTAAPGTLLTELSHSADTATRRALVTNPATPLNVLQEIAGQFPEELLLGNPALDVFLLENPTFFRDLPITLLRAVVKRENCSAGVLAQAATVDDEVVLLGVCQNEAAPVATLQALQNAASATVREAAALHVAVAGAVKDWPARVRAAVANRLAQAQPMQRLRSLPFLRLAGQLTTTGVASSAALPPLFGAIIQDAAGAYSNAAVLDRSACDEDRWVRRAVAKNPATPVALLERLAGDEDRWVRQAVARHPAMPVALLERLAGNENSGVRSTAAGHPATPVAVLERLAADKSANVRKAVAQNPATPLATLECLLHDQSDGVQSSARDGLSVNKLTFVTPPLLTPAERAAVEARLTQDAQQFTAANKPSLPRLLALLSPWTPVDALAKYFRSTWWEERAAIAIHPATPPATRAKLAEDGNVVVRAAARATLATQPPAA